MRILARSGSFVTYGIVTFHDRLSPVGRGSAVVMFTEYGTDRSIVLRVDDIIGIEVLKHV